MPTDAPASDPTVRTAPVLPTGGVVLPEMVVTIRLERAEAVAAVAAATGGDRHVVLVPRHPEATQAVGTLARIEQRGELAGGGDAIVVRGLDRVRVGRGSLDPSGALVVDVEPVVAAGSGPELAALGDRYRVAATRLLRSVGGSRLAHLLDDVTDPGPLADTIAWWPGLAEADRVRLLETVDVEDRLRLAIEWAETAANEAEVVGEIDRGVDDELAATQREAILRRRLAAIRAELGDTDDPVDDYRVRLAELETGGVGPAVVSAIATEIDRLERTGDQGQEAG